MATRAGAAGLQSSVMKRPILKRKVTTYTVVTWELSDDGEEPAAADPSVTRLAGEAAVDGEPAAPAQDSADHARAEDKAGTRHSPRG